MGLFRPIHKLDCPKQGTVHGHTDICGLILTEHVKRTVLTHVKLTVQPTTCTADGKCLSSPSLNNLKLQVTTEQKLLIQEKLFCESTAEILDFEFTV